LEKTERKTKDCGEQDFCCEVLEKKIFSRELELGCGVLETRV
jgi:hypothetical protein